MSNSESTTTAWVTVAEAAEKAQVDSGTVRQWYRSGRVPTRRAEGERGAFLVPLELVLSLVNPSDDAAEPPISTTSIEETLRELSVGYSSAETDATKEELATVSQELAQAREQLEFVRAQLAEATGENRTLKQQLQLGDDQRADLRTQLADAVDERKGVEARLLTVEAELTQLRRTAARSSITDNSWLDQATPAYESPVRRQAMSTPPPGLVPTASTPAPPTDGPTAPFVEAPESELADLLAATRPDDDEAETTPTGSDDFGDVREEYAPPRVVWTDEVPHPPLGESPDDLLPDHAKKGRFGKK